MSSKISVEFFRFVFSNNGYDIKLADATLRRNYLIILVVLKKIILRAYIFLQQYKLLQFGKTDLQEHQGETTKVKVRRNFRKAKCIN